MSSSERGSIGSANIQPTQGPSSHSPTVCRGDISLSQQLTASSIGALLTSLVVTPFDVVKIRLQSQMRPLAEGECFLFSNGLMDHLCHVCKARIENGNGKSNGKLFGNGQQCEWFNRPGHFNGTLDALVKITRNEGIRSLWSGLSPTLLSAIPATVFYFTLYDNMICALRDYYGNKVYVPLMAGSMARTAAVSVISPLELIRTKMQSERLTYKELGNAIRRTLKHDGYSALWRGWSATLLREIPFSAIYWTSYEFTKQQFLEKLNYEKTNFGVSFTCGAISGIIATILTMPADVIKTHQQITLGQIETKRILGQTNGYSRFSSQANIYRIGRELLLKEGVGSLFTGLLPRLARVVPSCAIMIGCYEHLKLLFAHQNLEHRRD